ncbi:MAG TPA: DUF4105 domain-containing protein [Longimicrobiales bacterium]|nr:DUF4105 domain-containing protein [Longimicrobiales bacterium]
MSTSSPLRAATALLAVTIALGPGQDAAAQTVPPDGAGARNVTAQAGSFDRYTVHLVTMSPGEAVWERFGHNGLWVEDHLTGTDTFFEWGVFSFQQVNFVARLIRGEMLYSMDVAPLAAKLSRYGTRTVWADELALTPDQEAALVAAMVENARPENAEYIYDYYDDNCSTRVRDMLDRAGVLDGALFATVADEPTDRSWRWHTLRLLQSQPWAYYGIHIAFGQPADRTIDRWESTFLPLKLRDIVREAQVPDGAGEARPLVVRERVLVEAGSLPPASKPAWLLPAALLGLALGGALFLLGGWARRAAAGRAVLGVVGFAVSAALGVAGTVMLGLWFFTDHDPAAWNEGVLQATPFHFILAILLLPLLIGRRPGDLTVRIARWLSALALLGLLLKVFPMFSQVNLELLVLTIPIQLGLAGAVARAGLAPGTVDRS